MRILKTFGLTVTALLVITGASRPRGPALAAEPLNIPTESYEHVFDVGPMAHVLPPPGREARLVEYAYRLADQLADAVFDRRELVGNRYARLHGLAERVVAACTTRLPPGRDWRYAAMLMWIGHRETRLCSAPRKLGNEDNGRAHGYWQIWSWKKLNPYSEETALDMLLQDPGAWYLPAPEPWVGYPDAARWIHEHPFVEE